MDESAWRSKMSLAHAIRPLAITDTTATTMIGVRQMIETTEDQGQQDDDQRDRRDADDGQRLGARVLLVNALRHRARRQHRQTGVLDQRVQCVLQVAAVVDRLGVEAGGPFGEADDADLDEAVLGHVRLALRIGRDDLLDERLLAQLGPSSAAI